VKVGFLGFSTLIPTFAPILWLYEVHMSKETTHERLLEKWGNGKKIKYLTET
jgi:hypothetical protein